MGGRLSHASSIDAKDAHETPLLSDHRQPSSPPPFQRRSWLHQFLFTYIYAVLDRGSSVGKLVWDDLPRLAAEDDPTCVLREYLTYSPQQRLHFPSTLWRMRWAPFLYSGFLLAVATASSLLTPLALHSLLASLDDPTSSSTVRYGWGLALSACSLASAFTLHRFWWVATRVGLHAQMAQSTDVLVASLSLSSSARSSMARGRLINHMSIDACRLNDNFVLPFLHWNTWAASLSIIVSVLNLYWLCGAAGLVGCSAMIVLLPASTLLTKYAKRNSDAVQERRDVRARLISDALGCSNMLKAYGWTDWFAGRIAQARSAEMTVMQRKQLLGVAADFVGISLPVLILALTLGLYAYWNPSTPLTPATAFAAVTWISNLQQPLRSMPNTITSFVDAAISLRRLRELQDAPKAQVGGLHAWVTWLGSVRRAGGQSSTADQPSPPQQQQQHEDAIALLVTPPPAQPALPMDNWLQPELLPAVDRDGFLHEPATDIDVSEGMNRAVDGDTISLQPVVELNHAAFGWPTDGISSSEGTEEDREKRALNDSSEGTPSDDAAATTAPTSCVPALCDVTLSCPAGSLTFVVGRIGSGKSTFLSGLIGEAQLLSGSYSVNGSIAYAGQSPWILNRSVRDNITLFPPTSPSRLNGPDWYVTVVSACALDVDIATFMHGHDTMIGENGVTLSGGQRARVALARALYADADVYLLDDVMAAVDAVVGAHLWTEAILRLLLGRGKTVVLASHALHLASRPEVAQVVLLEGGRVQAVGRYAELAHLQPQLMLAHTTYSASEPAGAADGTGTDPAAEESKPELAVPVETATDGPEHDATCAPAAGIDDSSKVPEGDVSQQQEETYASGAVRVSHLWTYVTAMGPPVMLVVLLVLYLASQAATIVTSWWLVVWTDGDGGGRSAGFYATVYACLSAGSAVFTLLRMMLLSIGSIRASTHLHNAAMTAVLRAPAAFLATNPAGRVLNRFTSDIATIDNTMRYSLSALLLQVFSLVSVLCVIAWTAPWALLIVACLAGLYYHLAAKYRTAARDLRRLQSVAKSPILAHFSEALSGAAVIRAYGPAAAMRVVSRHVALCREHARAYFAYWAANEFISTALEGIGSAVILAVTMLSVWQHGRGDVSTGSVGFALSFCLQLPQVFMWLIRQLSMVESDAVSVERLAEYMALQPEEEANVVPKQQQQQPEAPLSADAAPSSPPAALQLGDVWLRYAPNLPWVLKGTSLTLPEGVKMACVGRTGAGKTSLAQAVLRLYPYQRGRIAVGGVDLADVSIAQARASVVSLQQDAALFTGSLRDNLLGPHAARVQEADVRGVLARVGILQSVSGGSSLDLDEPVAEGGASLSAGERALLCLARALLAYHTSAHRPCLLVCDEPTAHVDPVADAATHDVILSMPCAVLCICHRRQYLHRFQRIAMVQDGAVTVVAQQP